MWKFLLKKIKKILTPENKTALLNGLAEKVKMYKSHYELQRGEDVIGLVVMSGDKIILSSCVVNMSETGSLKIMRCLHRYEGAELADLLIDNIDKVDLSGII